MTLKEYVNQKDPARMPVVQLKKTEYKKGVTYTSVMGKKRTYVFITSNLFNDKFLGITNEYIEFDDNKMLYATDGNGNARSKSCFRLE